MTAEPMTKQGQYGTAILSGLLVIIFSVVGVFKENWGLVPLFSKMTKKTNGSSRRNDGAGASTVAA
jgi:hypothetical protein